MSGRHLATIALAILLVSANATAQVPRCVQLTASANAYGQPPIAFAWAVDGVTVATTNPATIDTTSLAAGNHQLRVTVSNAAPVADAPTRGICGGGCEYTACASPAFGTPASLWGTLRPVDAGQLPANRDNTSYADGVPGAPLPGTAEPLWVDLDVSGTALFTALSHGLEKWDLSAPAAPSRTGAIGRAAFPTWPADPHEGMPVRTVATSSTGGVTVGLAGGAGVAVFTSALLARYADSGATAFQVRSLPIGSRDYAVAATNAGLSIYDVTAALALPSLCTETAASGFCGVHQATVGAGRVYEYLGVSNHAGRAFALASSGSNSQGFELWEISDPTNPVRRLTALPTVFVHGVALWHANGRLYAAARVPQFRAWDLTSCINGCSALPSQLFAINHPADFDNVFLTYSANSSRRFLHLGNFNRCSTATQNEWLYDVTDAAEPVEITPDDKLLGGILEGYWGTYYRARGGYNNVAGRVGRVAGNYLYRAAYSLFDVHELRLAAALQAAFDAPATIWAGSPVRFADASTGSPTAWSWTFQDGTPAASSSQNPSTTFPTPGAKVVTLRAANATGSSTTSTVVSVSDPRPVVTAIDIAVPGCAPKRASSSSTTLLAVAPLAFTGPPLVSQTAPLTITATAAAQGAADYRWFWGDGSSSSWVAGCAGATATHSYAAPGTYSAELRIRACGQVLTRAFSAVVTTDQPLSALWTPQGCNPFCVFNQANVCFDLQLLGSPTSYAYDWNGDGQAEQTAAGPVPCHNFPAGIWIPRLTMRNTSFATTVVSPPISVVLAPNIFADGFETGDTSAWSLAVP